MGINMKIKYIIAIIFIAFFILNIPLIYLGASDFIYTVHEKEYYSDSSNFITDNAIVDNIIYNKQDNYIVLWLSEIDESYQDNNFIVRAENAGILSENGFHKKVKTGDKITYISEPGYFGDGYMMPIVSISVNGEELLSFSEGYKNLMDTYK